ncbi:ribosome-inactivating family protein [Mycetocola saprophilus]|uniref:ribosome-inactivating family protein n=1 Tax=Mycetocola saprophilus TaxID=76636 RepID=UPI003BF1B51A
MRLKRHTLIGAATAVATAVALVAGSLLPTSAALADPPDFPAVADAWMNIGDAASLSQGTQYYQFIDSVRHAAGHDYRPGVLESTRTDGLIRVTLGAGNTRVILWLTAGNLYLRGFTAANGATFGFGDYDLRGELLTRHLLHGTYERLAFDSDYTSLAQASGRNRDTMPLSFGGIRGAVLDLGGATTASGHQRPVIARGLLLLVQFVSEAARFYEIYGVMWRMMATPDTLLGLTPFQMTLENNWGSISNFGHQISNNPSTPPLRIGTGITVSTFLHVANLIAILFVGTGAFAGTESGNPSRTEL